MNHPKRHAGHEPHAKTPPAKHESDENIGEDAVDRPSGHDRSENRSGSTDKRSGSRRENNR